MEEIANKTIEKNEELKQKKEFTILKSYKNWVFLDLK